VGGKDCNEHKVLRSLQFSVLFASQNVAKSRIYSYFSRSKNSPTRHLMQCWQIIFIISIFLVFYNYAGYAILIYFLNVLKGKRKIVQVDKKELPSVSFVVAAFNEEGFIREKILNSLEQDYPKELIEYIFVTDGSTDHTAAIIAEYPSIRLLDKPERGGKSAALNRAVESAKNDILIFSDANTILNQQATMNIARHYHDKKVGGVSGEKKVINPAGSNDEVSTGEGIYWKYESALKKIDSDFYSVVGAAGELFSLRSSLYQPISHDVILDDFVISLRVAQQGYRVVYEPDAFASELPSFSIKDEQKRKIRIAAGGFQAMGMLGSLFKFWKHPRLSFLYVSHRVLRWTLSPLGLLLAFVSNLILFLGTDIVFYKISFVLQFGFYAMAALAAFGGPKAKKIKLLKIPYYFTFMNVSVFAGFLRFLRGNQSAIWEKAKRLQTAVL
jgi:poly-beta-1,6-N-acetyl-D-glucosamine synthase